jgi:hypothetical protein
LAQEWLNVRLPARLSCCLLASCLCWLACAPRAGAVILMDKADRNTREPHGSLVGSGWQWQGQFGAFLGIQRADLHDERVLRRPQNRPAHLEGGRQGV